jgi:hypothetical protein
MTHSLHRYGTKENLQNDYVFYIRGMKIGDCYNQLQKVSEILLAEGPVNSRFHAQKKNFASDAVKDVSKSIEDIRGYACVFSSKERTKRVLKKLKEADIGLSVVVSGLIDEVVKMTKETGLKPHTVNLSLGIHGKKKALLPDDKVLELTTMCGHGLVGSMLVKTVFEKIINGKMSFKAGSRLLASQCPCGIFNLDRCEELFLASKETP